MKFKKVKQVERRITGFLENDLVESVVTTITVKLKEPIDPYSREYESIITSIRKEIEIPVRNYYPLIEKLNNQYES